MVDLHISCHYVMLCYALQRALPELSLLAKHCQPNGCNDQIALVYPFEGYKSDIPTTYMHLLHGLNHGPAHAYDHNQDHGPCEAQNLSTAVLLR